MKYRNVDVFSTWRKNKKRRNEKKREKNYIYVKWKREKKRGRRGEEGNLRLCLIEVPGSTEDLASSLTGRALTLRTSGKATRGRLTGTTLGTGDTRPR